MHLATWSQHCRIVWTQGDGALGSSGWPCLPASFLLHYFLNLRGWFYRPADCSTREGKVHAAAWKSCRAHWLQCLCARRAGGLGGPRWVQLPSLHPSCLPPGAEPGCWAPWQRLVTAQCYNRLCGNSGNRVHVLRVKAPAPDKIKQITTLVRWK